ncbi:hypothetical protein SmJEL517_g03670 [Synchytrium microbalum]|uniref:Mitochondrial import inner membrane translocase subunit n=1 Tax=Synchytrium microbalum TaxID=1806994 RepID=A0A507C7J1_9FUNG|nr:uncharacterized protein SmJEL517_g03670 [Synchytrium microbalum]TPX33455.1 hypothetical protein SmJEL517_g03670 [Synchytrium microbalum]
MSGVNAAQKTQVMNQVRSELAQQNFQELLARINTKCFEKCVLKPGSRLDTTETTCLSRCVDTYIQTWNLVSTTYLRRLQRESGNAR